MTTSYVYNQAGLPSAMDSEVLDQTTSYSYDAAGRLDLATTGGHVNDWSWHPDNSLAGVKNSDGSSSISEHVYRYFNGGNVKTQTTSGSSGAYVNDYGYAPGNQLKSWTHTPAGGTADTSTYAYDRNSNRTSSTNAGVTQAWDYNLDNSIKTFNPGAGGAIKTYAYNNAGHLTSDGCASTSYDDFDRVAKVELTAATALAKPECGKARTTAYTYDGLDRQRTTAVTSADPANKNGTTANIYDGLSSTLIGQKDAATGDSGSGGFPFPEVLYQLNPFGETAAYEQTGAGASKTFLDTDGRGNVTDLVNTGGTTICNVRYDAFGGAYKPDTGATSNGMCRGGLGNGKSSSGNASWYRGLVRDASTGMYQLGTRSYNPATGAFTTPDTYRVGSPATDLSVGVDPLTMNTYTYVNGNPVNAWDPTGHGLRSWAKKKVKSGYHHLKSAGGAVVDGAEKVGNGAKHLVSAGTKAVASGVELVGDGIEKTGELAGDAYHSSKKFVVEHKDTIARVAVETVTAIAVTAALAGAVTCTVATAGACALGIAAVGFAAGATAAGTGYMMFEDDRSVGGFLTTSGVGGLFGGVAGPLGAGVGALARTALPRFSGAGASALRGFADGARRNGKVQGAVSQLTLADGGAPILRESGGLTNLMPQLRGVLDGLPARLQRFRSFGQCSEIACLDQALREGRDLAGSTIETLAVGGTKPGHGLPKPPCPVCERVLDAFDIGVD